MPEPSVESTPEAASELETLRRTVAELTKKASTRKARIEELQTSAAALQTRATEAEAKIKALLIDSPINELCSSISVAPQALRDALEKQFKIELRDGVLTLVDPASDKPATHEGKQVPFTADGVRNLLLASKDQEKLKLYQAIVVASKASGAASKPSIRATSTPSPPG